MVFPEAWDLTLHFPSFIKISPDDTSRALLRGEQLRVSAVILCALVVSVAGFIRISMSARGFGQGDFPYVAACLILLFMLYEGFSLHLIHRRIGRGKGRSFLKAWFDSILEGVLPFILGTAAILDTYANPYVVATGPLVMAALLLVVLTILRFNPWMCLASGVFATIAYILMIVWIHAEYPLAEYEGYVYPSTFFPIAIGLLFAVTIIGFLISFQSRSWLHAAWHAAENMRLRQEAERELLLASDVQRELLPRDWPDGGVFDVAGYSRPAGKLSGDFYDWVPISGDRVLMCLADVTGHGAASAMLGAECRAYLRSTAPDAVDLPDLVARLEKLLMLDLRSGTFITMVLILLDTQRGSIQVLSAGQGPILIVRADGGIEEVSVDRPPLGIPGSDKVGSTEVALGDGDLLVTISDGVLDRKQHSGQDLGLEGYRDLLLRVNKDSARAVVDGIFLGIDEFAQGEEAPDDASALVVRRSSAAGGIGSVERPKSSR